MFLFPQTHKHYPRNIYKGITWTQITLLSLILPITSFNESPSAHIEGFESRPLIFVPVLQVKKRLKKNKTFSGDCVFLWVFNKSMFSFFPYHPWLLSSPIFLFNINLDAPSWSILHKTQDIWGVISQAAYKIFTKHIKIHLCVTPVDDRGRLTSSSSSPFGSLHINGQFTQHKHTGEGITWSTQWAQWLPLISNCR